MSMVHFSATGSPINSSSSSADLMAQQSGAICTTPQVQGQLLTQNSDSLAEQDYQQDSKRKRKCKFNIMCVFKARKEGSLS